MTMVPPSKRKRRRTWESLRRISGVVFASSALPTAFGQDSFYATCRGQLQSVDLDGDEALSEAEFSAFLLEVSGGTAILGDSELPAAISEAFANRQNDATQLMDISAGSGGAVDFFCKEIILGLQEMYDVSVDNNDCISALQAGDIEPMNGQLGTNEYVKFLNSLTASQDYSDPFESLSIPLQNTFNDMASEGFIDGTKGTEYLVEFCERSLLAAIVPLEPPTPAPSLVAGSTPIPTIVGSTTGSANNTAAPSSLGSGATVAPAAQVANSTLTPTTVGMQATSLPSSAGSGNMTELPTLISSTSLPTALNSGDTSSPTAPGSNDLTLRPTTLGTISGTEPTLSPTLLPTVVGNTPAPTFASLSASQFNTCKTSLVVSDINRNDRLEQQEFVRFISRMASGSTHASHAAFQGIDRIYRDLYDGLAAKASDGLPHLEGTKPGTAPSREERAVILDICQATYQAIRRYEQDGPSSPDGDNGDDSAGSDEEFFQTCRSAMVVSDLNRDDVLEESEFVRFASRLRPDIFNRVSRFQQLDPAFRASYDEVSSLRGVSIFGSKPGQRTTAAQDGHLENVCQSARRAIDTIVANGDGSNPIPPPTSAPTLSPGSITADFFRRCKTAMLISDLDRDDSLSREEYVRLLNRLTLSQFAGKGFNELDAIFQLGFYKVAVNGLVDVNGSKPGQSVERKTADHLSHVCENVKQSLDVFALTGGTGVVPTSDALTKAPIPLTLQPSRSPATRSELVNCQESIAQADTNRNFLLEEEEFAKFVGSSSTQSIASPFRNLPSPYVFAFRQAASPAEAVDLANIDKSHLGTLCEAILAQGDLSVILSPQTCSVFLFSSDVDGNNKLTEEEYVNFVNEFQTSAAESFDTLPFILRENFSWMTLKQSYLDIDGVMTFEGLQSGDDIRLQWMCERTGHMLMAVEEDDSVSLDDHCEFTIRLSDADSNGFIDQEEFMGLLRRFSGANLSGLDFQSIASFHGVFNAAKSDDNSMIDVETASTNGVCFELEKAVDEERDSETFFELCLSSLRVADVNADESLSKDEYIPFLYYMAILYGEAEEIPAGLHFENLNQVLQLNFDVLAGQNDFVLISGVQSRPNEAQFGDLRWVCQNIDGTMHLISATQETSVTIYNAFYVSNTKGVVAADLEDGPDRDLLEAAYSEFVEDQVRVMLKVRKTRKLNVAEYVQSSASIYQVDDVQCYPDLPSTAHCQVVYGSFDLSLFDVNNTDSAAAKYSETTQLSIDRGALQIKLVLLDSMAAFNVEQAVNPAQPSSDQIFMPTRRPGSPAGEAPEEDEASLFLTLLSGALVSFAIFGTLYYCFFYIGKGKTLCGQNKQIDSSDDDMKSLGKRSEQADPSRTGDDEETGFSGRLEKDAATKTNSAFDEDNVSVESSTDGSFGVFVASATKAISAQHNGEGGSSTSSGSSDHVSSEEEEIDSDDSHSSDNQSSDPSDRLGESVGSESLEAPSVSASDQSVDVVNIAKSSLHSDSNGSTSTPGDEIDDFKDEEEEKKPSNDSKSTDSESDPNPSEEEESMSQNLSESLSAEANSDEGESSIEASDGDDEESSIEASDGDDVVDGTESMSYDEADTLVHSTMSLDTADLNVSYEKYRPIVEDLVRQVVPDEINNVDTMMEQFIGRERELVRTLRNMAGIEDSEDDSDGFEPSDYSAPSDYSEETEENEFTEGASNEEESLEEESIESEEE